MDLFRRRRPRIRRRPDRRNPQKPNNDNDNKANNPPNVTIILNKDDLTPRLEQAKKSSKLLVMEFTAKTSAPCKLMEPVLQEVALKHTTNADFWKIDVEVFDDFARKMRVEALPTFLLWKNGEVVGRVVGVKKEDLESSIKPHISEEPSKEEKPASEDQKKAEQQN